MRKITIFIIAVVTIIASVIGVKYINYKSEKNKIKEDNLEYEMYLNKHILGTELTTFINKAVDNNKKHNVPKDEKGFFIQNDINSVEIEVKITDNDTLYKMETLYGAGMVNFVQYYNSILFECTKISYNKLGKVNYVLFEQRSN